MPGTNRRRLASAAVLFAALIAGPMAAAEDPPGWPREIDTPEGHIIHTYQPQPETLNGDVLTGRAACSVTAKGSSEPVFGVMWLSSRIETDRDERIYHVKDLKITKVRFPEATPDQEKAFIDIVQEEVSAWDLSGSLDQLTATLAATERERESAAALKADPPKAIVSEEPAVLLLFDGEPKWSPIESSNLERVINTPYLVVRSKGARTAYLNGSGYWYSASDAKGPWQKNASPPQEIAGLVAPDSTSLAAQQIPPPAIVVSTEPTELIAFTGKPNYAPITGTDLLYASNTESDILRDMKTQDVYWLVSGRWFKSRSLEGPWSFVPPDEIPADFALIPSEAPVGEVRASIPGTDEAEEAVADAQIPQTQTIKRDATITVTYDGDPRFEKIAGTEIESAVNTSYTVLKIKGGYYCCNEAVWYESTSPRGPWKVATEKPKEVDQIPPSDSAYNTKFVEVYDDSKPDVVVVGYTPAYMGWYPYYGSVWYGTGYRYPCWHGPYYYPRPVTYGFHAHYNPWYGWSFGMSWSMGFMSAGMSWGGHGGYYRPPHHGGWYGPGGYRPPPVFINTGSIHIGNKVNIGNQIGSGNRPRPTPYNRDQNIYNRPENRDRNVPATRDRPAGKQPKMANDRKNDVISSREGDLYRRNPDGSWDKRQPTREWKPDSPGSGAGARPETRPAQPQQPTTRPAQPARPETRPAQPQQPTTRPAQPTRPETRPAQPQQRDRSQMERDYRARQRGSQNAQRAQQARPQQRPSQPAPRPSGGGRRR